MVKDKKVTTKAGTKMGASIGGIYVWTQRDFNNLMSQLATIQGTVNSLSTRLLAMQQTQTLLQGNLQTVQTNVQSSLASVQLSLSKITTQEAKQMSALDDLKAAVQQTQDVEQSAVTLIQGIAKQLNDALANNSAAANDPVLAQLRDQLNSSAAELASAITANTAQPAPAPDPNAPTVSPTSASLHGR